MVARLGHRVEAAERADDATVFDRRAEAGIVEDQFFDLRAVVLGDVGGECQLFLGLATVAVVVCATECVVGLCGWNSGDGGSVGGAEARGHG